MLEFDKDDDDSNIKRKIDRRFHNNKADMIIRDHKKEALMLLNTAISEDWNMMKKTKKFRMYRTYNKNTSYI